MSTSKVTGGAELLAKLRDLQKQAPAQFAAALQQEAEAVMTLSKQEAPVDTGRLRASGFVEAPRNTGGVITVRLGYGADYALAVHERTWVKHPTGKAKFLTDPMKARAVQFKERMVARILKMIGGAK